MSSRISPGWACLVLVVCLLAVGFHFFGESLTAARAGLPTSRAGQAFHPGHDLAGDQFVLSASVALFGESGRLWGPPPLILAGGLASFTPPTPPPDL
jgi:hypothetical protein